MKKSAFLFITLLLLASCKEDTIPVVSVGILPASFVGHNEAPMFDTFPCQYTFIETDTILIPVPSADSIIIDTLCVSDTLVVDSFRLDTFYLDTIRLNACINYPGNKPFGPALQEMGFCVNESILYSVRNTEELKTPRNVYDTFMYVMPVRTTAAFLVHAFAVNPSGEMRSHSLYVRVADLSKKE